MLWARAPGDRFRDVGWKRVSGATHASNPTNHQYIPSVGQRVSGPACVAIACAKSGESPSSASRLAYCHTFYGGVSAMTNELPYTVSQSSLTRFLAHIQNAGVPPKVDREYLPTVGFKSGNDGFLITILKKLGFVGSGGVPENMWRSYRDKQRAPMVLAAGIQKAYAKLFETYPDAYNRDDQTLRNWFRPTTGLDEVKIGHAVATFKTLCSLADFSTQPTPPPNPHVALPNVKDAPLPPGGSSTPVGPSVNINIELTLPPSTDGVSYDKFFEAMKKHLFPGGPERA